MKADLNSFTNIQKATVHYISRHSINTDTVLCWGFKLQTFPGMPVFNNNNPVRQDADISSRINDVVTGRFPVQWMDLGTRHCLVRDYFEPKLMGSMRYHSGLRLERAPGYNEQIPMFYSL